MDMDMERFWLEQYANGGSHCVVGLNHGCPGYI